MEFAIILFLALLNGLLAMAEMAVVSAKKARLSSLAKAGGRGAEKALHLQGAPELFLPTVQVGITVVGTVSAAFGGSSLAGPLAQLLAQVQGLAHVANSLAFTIVVGVIAYLNLVLGELVPKRLALHFPERLAIALAPFLVVFARLARPLVWLLGMSTNLVLRLFSVKPSQDPPVTEEEIKHLLAEGTRAGVFEREEQDLVHRVLGLDDRPVSRIMRPSSEVTWLDLHASPSQNLDRIRSSTHSKFPVCQGSLHSPIGVIGVRDLFVHTTADSDEFRGLTDELQAPLLVPEHLTALEVLEKFKSTGIHLGLVVDEYGGVQGIVTPNDVFEAIVGDIPRQGEVEAAVTKREDGSLLIDGSLAIDDFFELLQISAPAGLQYHTLAGFVIERLGQIPKAGDRFEFHDWIVEVVDMDNHRVDKILVRK